MAPRGLVNNGRRSSTAYLGVGLAASVVAALLWAPLGGAGLAAVAFSGVVALVTALTARPAKPAAAALVLLALVGVLAIKVLWMAVLADGEPPGFSTGEGLALASAAMLVVTLVVLTPSVAGTWRDTWYDAGVAALALALLWWAVVADPILGRERLDASGTVLVVAFPLLAIAELLLTIRLAIRVSREWRPLYVSGFGLAIIATVTEGATFAQRAGGEIGVVSVLLWVVAIVVLSAAGLRGTPTGVPATDRPDRAMTSARTVFLGALTAIPPLVLIVRWVLQRPTVIESNTSAAVLSMHLVVPVVLSTLLAVLLIVRAGSLANRLHANAQDLKQSLAAREALQAELEYRAHHDSLTGLHNRSVLDDRLSASLAAAVPSSLLLIDLDGFKSVNDRYGHPLGDQLLCAVADRLTATVPTQSTICRLGGDEFAVLLPTSCGHAADDVAAAVLTGLRPPFHFGSCSLTVTASIGVLPLDAEKDRQEALVHADEALYHAKSRGKDVLAVFGPALR